MVLYFHVVFKIDILEATCIHASIMHCQRRASKFCSALTAHQQADVLLWYGTFRFWWFIWSPSPLFILVLVTPHYKQIALRNRVTRVRTETIRDIKISKYFFAFLTFLASYITIIFISNDKQDFFLKLTILHVPE